MFQPSYFSATKQLIFSKRIVEPLNYGSLSAQLEYSFDLMAEFKVSPYFDMLEIVKQKISNEINYLNKLFLEVSLQLIKVTSHTTIRNEHEAILSHIMQFCERVEKLNTFFLEEVNEGLQRLKRNTYVKISSVDYKKLNFSLIAQKIDILHQKSQRWIKRYKNHITHITHSNDTHNATIFA